MDSGEGALQVLFCLFLPSWLCREQVVDRGLHWSSCEDGGKAQDLGVGPIPTSEHLGEVWTRNHPGRFEGWAGAYSSVSGEEMRTTSPPHPSARAGGPYSVWLDTMEPREGVKGQQGQLQREEAGGCPGTGQDREGSSEGEQKPEGV